MWPWKNNKQWWRNGTRDFPWEEGDYLLAEKAYESYTTAFYINNKFATTTHVAFKDLPVAAKEVWRKTAEDIARWTLLLDSARGDLD